MENKVPSYQRIRQVMDEQNLRQSDVLELARPLCKQYNTKLGKSALSQYVSGKVEPGQDKLYILSQIFNVSEAWLMGFDVPRERTDYSDQCTEPTDLCAELSTRLSMLTEKGQDYYSRIFIDILDNRKGSYLTDEEILLISSWRQASEDERIEISHILRKYGFHYSGAEDAEPQIKYIRHYLTAAAAGYASPIEGEDFELIPIDGTVPPHADFCIDIDGDSMEPYIKNGQRVYVQRDVSLKEFEPGIFFVDGDVYCKQWCIDYAGTLHLLSANPKREDANISIPRDSGRNVVCYGKVLLGQKLPQPFYP